MFTNSKEMRMSRVLFAAEQRFRPMRMLRLLFAGKLANQNGENNE